MTPCDAIGSYVITRLSVAEASGFVTIPIQHVTLSPPYWGLETTAGRPMLMLLTPEEYTACVQAGVPQEERTILEWQVQEARRGGRS